MILLKNETYHDFIQEKRQIYEIWYPKKHNSITLKSQMKQEIAHN